MKPDPAIFRLALDRFGLQAADAVFGVTMQEPGVSTIVGVRLGEQERAA